MTGILQIKKLSLKRLCLFANGKNRFEDTKADGEDGTN